MVLESLELRIANAQLGRLELEFEVIVPMTNGDLASSWVDSCEEAIRGAIEAYKWLSRAEETLLEADLEGLFPWTDEMEQSFHSLHRRWLALHEKVTPWVLRMEQEGRRPNSLAKFHECRDRTEQWLARRELSLLSLAALEEGFEREERE